VGAGAVTSLLTLVAVSRVWSRAFWRPAAQPAAADRPEAAARDAGPDVAEEPVDGDEPSGDGVPQDASGDGSSRSELRRAAWERHTAVATAPSPSPDGLGDGGDRRRPESPLPRVMLAAAAGMVTVTVALTALAGPLYAVADRAAADLLDRRPYVTAVLGGQGERP
jgi:multicomponent Na+:H+ antiporter subunit D